MWDNEVHAYDRKSYDLWFPITQTRFYSVIDFLFEGGSHKFNPANMACPLHIYVLALVALSQSASHVCIYFLMLELTNQCWHYNIISPKLLLSSCWNLVQRLPHSHPCDRGHRALLLCLSNLSLPWQFIPTSQKTILDLIFSNELWPHLQHPPKHFSTSLHWFTSLFLAVHRL